MRDRGSESVMGPWVCVVVLLVVPGSWAGDALCPVMSRSRVDGAHRCRTIESLEKLFAIWVRQCVFH